MYTTTTAAAISGTMFTGAAWLFVPASLLAGLTILGLLMAFKIFNKTLSQFNRAHGRHEYEQRFGPVETLSEIAREYDNKVYATPQEAAEIAAEYGAPAPAPAPELGARLLLHAAYFQAGTRGIEETTAYIADINAGKLRLGSPERAARSAEVQALLDDSARKFDALQNPAEIVAPAPAPEPAPAPAPASTAPDAHRAPTFDEWVESKREYFSKLKIPGDT